MGSVEPWWMARWKARVDVLLTVIKLVFYLLPLRRYKAKLSNLAAFRRGGSLQSRFQGKGSSLGNVFGFYKTRHILLSDCANCTVLRAVVLTIPACDRQTDRRTDRRTNGIAKASTALAMRALWRAVKRRNTIYR